MNLHDDLVALGDRVYDVSVGRGYGQVILIEPDGHMQVRFDRYAVNYDSMGIQQGKTDTTLFWSKPLMIKPRKQEAHWGKKEELVNKFFRLVADYREFV
jgi:hypothetical protein